ncbi:MAG: hypothetical protein AB8G95_25485 [Anaerolineae bacterium]
MDDLLLTKPYLISPKAYWTSAFDGSEGVEGDSFEKYQVAFTCRSCEVRIDSAPLVPDSKSVVWAEPDLRSIDPVEFLSRCERLSGRERMGSPYYLVQGCQNCESQYLILFGATEWQPTRYIIMLSGIYDYR